MCKWICNSGGDAPRYTNPRIHLSQALLHFQNLIPLSLSLRTVGDPTPCTFYKYLVTCGRKSSASLTRASGACPLPTDCHQMWRGSRNSPTSGLVLPLRLPCLIYRRPLSGNYCVSPPWLRHCDTSSNVAGSIPDGVIGIFHWHNPSGRTMALGSTQPLTEVSTRDVCWGGNGGRCAGLTLPPTRADCLEIWEPHRPGTWGH